ncbi:MAG TPA: hypothetical protein VLY20_01285 [Nitrospiria bacterium]|nr:hypothetical protein [Nitrospiria bacterium]
MLIPGLQLSTSRAGTARDAPGRSGESASPQTYATNNLKRLLQMVSGLPKPHVLDLGRLSGPNIEWLVQRGFKIYVDDHISSLKPAPPPSTASRSEKKKSSPPLLEPLDYAPALFDAVLCWDIFDYLAPVQAQDLVAGISRTLKPKGLLLAFFNFNRSSPPPPVRYRILHADRIEYAPLGIPPISRRVYENREIQELFPGFDTVNSCFLKNQMREVLVQRHAG